MSATLDNILDNCEGKSNAQGLKNRLYIANLADVDVIPDVTANTLKIESDITMVTGKTFKFFDFSPNEQSFKSTPEGDEDGRIFMNELKIFIPRVSPHKSVVLSCNDLCPKLIIFEDQNGERQKLGEKANGAYYSVEQQATPKNGYIVTIKSKESTLPKFYNEPQVIPV